MQRGRLHGGRETDYSSDSNPRSKKMRIKQQTTYWSKYEILAVLLSLLSLLYICLHSHSFHLHVTRLYAGLGHPTAQHLLGQRYLTGEGVEKDGQTAMEWFRLAADQGHPHSSYNLAVGMMRNISAARERGEVERFLSKAASHGIVEAQILLEELRTRDWDLEPGTQEE
ncbi:secretory immunoglobulin A-binding protein EsiB-like [Acipenser oxyrinchus oxyrinchus]|nr:secretory immunoglobulin A-binding protein EsiB-like [Acipenser oxyrinchus oxyrinchus]